MAGLVVIEAGEDQPGSVGSSDAPGGDDFMAVLGDARCDRELLDHDRSKGPGMQAIR